MESDNCKHDFQAFLECSICQTKYDIAMVEIINQAKIDTANQILQGIRERLDKDIDIDRAMSEAINVFENNLKEENAEVVFMGTKDKIY